VYTQQGGTWNLVASWTDPGDQANDMFGQSVSIAGNVVVIGAPGAGLSGPGGGAVYSFLGSDGNTQWESGNVVSDPGGSQAGDDFGESVAVTGGLTNDTTLVVGAPGSGKVYTYTGPLFSGPPVPLKDPGQPGDHFGASVAIDMPTADRLTIMVGAPFATVSGQSNAGAAYVYTSTGPPGSAWTLTAPLTDPAHQPGDAFGSAVAVFGPAWVVGAPGSNASKGAAYIYAFGSEAAFETDPTGQSPDAFGSSVSVESPPPTNNHESIIGATAVIGAPGADQGAGGAYVFTRSEPRWYLQSVLAAADAYKGHCFGSSVAFSGPVTVVGAPCVAGIGAAYIFTDTLDVGYAGGQVDFAGHQVALQMTGSSTGGFPLTWSATGLPPGLHIGSTSGLISGTPTTPGTYQVTVNATDSTRATATAQFTWTIKQAPMCPPGSSSQAIHAVPLFGASHHVVAATSYTFSTLEDSADPTFNQLLAINDHNVIGGYFGSGADAQHPNKGYVLNPPYGQGNYTNENFPGSVQTQVTGLNDLGDTTGFWANSANTEKGFVKWKGVFTSLTNPCTPKSAGSVNQLLGINNFGVAVGFYNDAKGNSHPYQVNRATHVYTAIRIPGAVSALATGINNDGDIVGIATDANKVTTSWLRSPAGQLTTLQFPGGTDTQAFGINPQKQIVGSYLGGNGVQHGFVLTNPQGPKSHWQSIDDPNGVGSTVVNGINTAGDLVGFYTDPAGNTTNGFLATP
jgi:hypothetical protein